MPSYVMYMTLDHRLDCTKAKVQYTSKGDTDVFYVVEEPEFVSPTSCFNELLFAAKNHHLIQVDRGEVRPIVKDDDGA